MIWVPDAERFTALAHQPQGAAVGQAGAARQAAVAKESSETKDKVRFMLRSVCQAVERERVASHKLFPNTWGSHFLPRGCNSADQSRSRDRMRPTDVSSG